MSRRSVNETPDHDVYRPIKRIRQACQNCRRKKARCTGEKPECAFCARLGQYCSYSDEESPATDNSSLPNRMKTKNVESSKDTHGEMDVSARLFALENQMGELLYTVKSIESSMKGALSQFDRTLTPSGFNAIQTPGPSHLAIDAAPSTPYLSLPSQKVLQLAADLYFRFCHNQPYSLFHEHSFRKKLHSNSLPAHLLFALLASTARYSNDPYLADKHAASTTYAQQSWKSIVMPWNGIQSDAELSIVQTILLLAIVDYTDGRTQASWIKVGLAIRLAQDFRLMSEPDSNLSPVQQEERRRVFWSFYLCDKLVSCGRERPAAILDDHCRLRLPGDENEWRAGNYRQQAPTLEKLTDDNSGSALASLSPFASTVVIASLLGRCVEYALGEKEEHPPASEKLLPWSPKSKYSAIHSALLQHEAELGMNEPLSGKIMRTCLSPDGTVDQHLAAPLVLSHALYCLCQCLLYHPFLLKQRICHIEQQTPRSFFAQVVESCRLAATSLSRLIGDVKSLECDILTTSYDPFYGYCTMVAGTIHSLFFQSSDPVVRETAHTSFESSIQNLQELSVYWKSCAMMRARLEDFRANSDRYASLINPAVHDVDLSENDASDLIECLDYARISTTPRRRSQTAAADISTMPQLPSPFFEELANLLPIGYSRAGIDSSPFDNSTMFGQHMVAFDQNVDEYLGADRSSSTTMSSLSPMTRMHPTTQDLQA